MMCYARWCLVAAVLLFLAISVQAESYGLDGPPIGDGIPIDEVDKAYEAAATAMGVDSDQFFVIREDCTSNRIAACNYRFKGDVLAMASARNPKEFTRRFHMFAETTSPLSEVATAVEMTIAVLDPDISRAKRGTMTEILIAGMGVDKQSVVTGVNAVYEADASDGLVSRIYIYPRN